MHALMRVINLLFFRSSSRPEGSCSPKRESEIRKLKKGPTRDAINKLIPAVAITYPLVMSCHGLLVGSCELGGGGDEKRDF